MIVISGIPNAADKLALAPQGPKPRHFAIGSAITRTDIGEASVWGRQSMADARSVRPRLSVAETPS